METRSEWGAMRHVVSSVIVLSLLLAPALVLAEEDADAVPTWVPWTVAGVFVLGGALFLYHHLAGESHEVRSPQQHAQDLIAYISTPQERAELEKVTAGVDVQAFLDHFFLLRDPTPGTPENEFREEHTRRFRHANAQFEGPHGGWESDRGRVYILYGPPGTVALTPSIEWQMEPWVNWKAAEFWEYATKAGGNRMPDLFQEADLFDRIFHIPLPSRGRMLFVFAERSIGGGFLQIYSTEPGETGDPSLFR
jgi:GWxTD domain-containing protein